MAADRERYSVMLVSSADRGAKALASMLPAAMFSPVVRAASAGEAKRRLSQSPYDIVLVDTPLSDEFGTQFAVDIAKDSCVSILLLVRPEVYETVSYKVEGHGIFTLSKPGPRAVFYQAVRLMASNSARLKAMWSKNMSLKAKMEELRVVDHAKWVLIERLHMDEAAAHRYLEREAMDTRSTKRAAAEGIILRFGDKSGGLCKNS